MDLFEVVIKFKAHPENPEPEDLDFIYKHFPPGWKWMDQIKKSNGVRYEVFHGPEQGADEFIEYINGYFDNLVETKRVIILKKTVH